MKASIIAITTTTYYPKWYQGPLRSINHTDKIRGDLALEFISKSVQLGHPTIVIDGMSTKTYIRKIKEIPGVILKKRISAKRSPARRLAFLVASKIPEVKVIVNAEPEKTSLLDFISEITAPLLTNEADIVVPKREEKTFKETYPDFQYHSEIEGNKLYNEYMHLHHAQKIQENYDMFFGPRAFRNDPKVLRFFFRKYLFRLGDHIFSEKYFDPEQFSNALFFPVVLALKKGLRVKSVEIPFRYPKLQKENEEKGNRHFFEEKRQMQRLTLLVELMHFLSYLEHNNRSKIKSKETVQHS